MDGDDCPVIGKAPKGWWWKRVVPASISYRIASLSATWRNGVEMGNLINYDKNPDADIYRNILLLIYIHMKFKTRDEKLEIMHKIREAFGVPDIRKPRPIRLPYLGDDE